RTTVAGAVGDRFGPKLWWPRFLDADRSADGVRAGELRHRVFRRQFAIRRHREAGARNRQTALRAEEFERGVAGRSFARFAVRPDGRPIRMLEQTILRVRCLAIVLQAESPAGARHGLRSLDAEIPVDDVEGVLAEVGHLSAGTVPEPAEMIDGAVEIVLPRRRG